jgi:hypothetical protein
MNLKNIIAKIAAKKAVSKILPMDGAKPVLGKKAKAAALLTAIAAVATAGAQYLGG